MTEWEIGNWTKAAVKVARVIGRAMIIAKATATDLTSVDHTGKRLLDVKIDKFDEQGS